jgi:hypothetical protein
MLRDAKHTWYMYWTDRMRWIEREEYRAYSRGEAALDSSQALILPCFGKRIYG